MMCQVVWTKNKNITSGSRFGGLVARGRCCDSHVTPSLADLLGGEFDETSQTVTVRLNVKFLHQFKQLFRFHFDTCEVLDQFDMVHFEKRFEWFVDPFAGDINDLSDQLLATHFFG